VRISGAKPTPVILKDLSRAVLNSSRALEEAASQQCNVQDDSPAEDGEYNHRLLIFLPGLDLISLSYHPQY